MRAEHLYEFIVPFIFVAIWAVTWILNREAQPLPPRNGRRFPDDRSGTNSGDVRGPATQRPATATNSLPTSSRSQRPISTTLDRSRDRERGRLTPDDAIVFTEFSPSRPSEPTDVSASPRPMRGTQSRRGAKPKETGGAKPRNRQAPEKPRELTQQVSSSMAQFKNRPLELTPLNLPLSPLTSLPLAQSGFPLGSPSSTPDSDLRRRGGSPLDTRKALADPRVLREIFVWNELLQPPVALRKGPSGRR
jgi:hypothetical protein